MNFIPKFSSHPEPVNGFLKLAGSYADYNILLQEGKIIIEDLRHKGFGKIEYLPTFYKVGFDDISEISLFQRNPYHVSDIVDFDGKSNISINASELVKNDKDFYGANINVLKVLNAVGGEVTLDNGVIYFIPDVQFKGIRKFSYTVKNSDGFVNSKPINVFLREPHHPNDPKFFEQWYLTEANILDVWKDYNAKGIKVAVFDEGFVPNHVDLDVASQEFQLDFDNSFDQHALMVAGVIAAKKDNGEGVAGIASEADVSVYQIPFRDLQKLDFEFFKDFDVINNSWGGSIPNLNSDLVSFDEIKWIAQFRDLITNGREGKGCNIVFASGNSGIVGDDSAISVFTNNEFIINVGGYSKNKDLITYGTKMLDLATPGGTVLVSAPYSEFPVLYASGMTFSGSKMNFGNNGVNVIGTSFAAPVVSSVVALMLEANPKLGFRDIQDILSISAVPNTELAKFNASTSWNGGGMYFDKQQGFGKVDALAAVRLAETAYNFHTHANYEEIYSHQNQVLEIVKIDFEQDGFILPIEIRDDMLIEYASLHLNISLPSSVSNYQVVLKSPKGTEFEIINGIGTSDLQKKHGINEKSIKWDFGLQHAKGEHSKGEWKVVIKKIDELEGKGSFTESAILRGYGINFLGKPVDDINVQYFTNSFAEVYSAARSEVKDDVQEINASAVSKDIIIDLTGQTESSIAGNKITLSKEAQIEVVKLGDGDDTIVCSDLGNVIYPGRGNDSITLGEGDDIVIYTNYKLKDLGIDKIYKFNPEHDQIILGGGLEYSDLNQRLQDSSIEDELYSTKIVFDDWAIELVNVKANQLTEENFILVA